MAPVGIASLLLLLGLTAVLARPGHSNSHTPGGWSYSYSSGGSNGHSNSNTPGGTSYSYSGGDSDKNGTASWSYSWKHDGTNGDNYQAHRSETGYSYTWSSRTPPDESNSESSNSSE